jgi:hypothetical protein
MSRPGQQGIDQAQRAEKPAASSAEDDFARFRIGADVR